MKSAAFAAFFVILVNRKSIFLKLNMERKKMNLYKRLNLKERRGYLLLEPGKDPRYLTKEEKKLSLKELLGGKIKKEIYYKKILLVYREDAKERGQAPCRVLHNLDKDTYKVLYGKVLVRPRGIYLDAISLIKALNLIKYTVVKPLPNAVSDAILKQ